MIHRRSFLLGAAPVAAASAIVPAVAPERKDEVVVTYLQYSCTCGWHFLVEGCHWEPEKQFVRCGNSECAQFGKAFSIPRFCLPVAPADPAVVAEVDAAYARQREIERQDKEKPRWRDYQPPFQARHTPGDTIEAQDAALRANYRQGEVRFSEAHIAWCQKYGRSEKLDFNV